MPFSSHLLIFLLHRCAIDLSRLEREKTHNIWQDLEDGNGSIFLLLTISGTTQSETITDLSSYKENPRDREIIERRYVSYLCNDHREVSSKYRTFWRKLAQNFCEYNYFK